MIKIDGVEKTLTEYLQTTLRAVARAGASLRQQSRALWANPNQAQKNWEVARGLDVATTLLKREEAFMQNLIAALVQPWFEPAERVV
jgi:hypothetical protein